MTTTLLKSFVHSFAYCLLLCMTPFAEAKAQAEENRNSSGQVRRQFQTQKIDEGAIRMDGIIDEPVWDLVSWQGDFTQYQPKQGEEPYLETQFRILYDDKYLYFAGRAFDHSPDSIEARLSRRDQFPGDWIEVNIDSYHDLRTAFSFTLSVSGVKGDEFISENGNFWDVTWNPIWEMESNIDSLGWTAEARIPLSQLRYGNQEDPVWGLQVQRIVFRKQERSTWQYIPQSSGGWCSEFGELKGLQGLPKNRQIELAPYVLAQTETFEAEPENPYADGTRGKINAGLDGKISVTRDLILDFTVNPDFGQVEADPGALRIDGYEIFFQERRPFFLENKNIFDYRLTGSQGGQQFDNDQLFYSRRIGGSPHTYPALSDGEYAEVPGFTSILGAAKFSGKTKGGVSIGALECITNNEYAKVSDGAQEREVLVEPLTNYFVGRLAKDFKQGNTVLGGTFTAVNRKEGVPELHTNAYSGAVDLLHFWKNRWWFINVKGLLSIVEGSAETIFKTQTNFVHLFQRTTADHVTPDPTRTSLFGTGGTIRIGKFGGQHNEQGGVWKLESGVTWRSPEFELNDIGFLSSADEINHFTWVSYAIQKPFSVFRAAQFNYNHWARWDFGGRFLYNQYNVNTNLTLKSNWMIHIGADWNPYDISNNALRGASAIRRPPGGGVSLNVQTDPRKKVSAGFNTVRAFAYQKAVQFQSYGIDLDFQLSDALNFNIAPNYSRFIRLQDQFVENVNYNGATRSVVSYVNNRTLSIATRLNYYITPDLSLQYYGEPFLFRATYKDYGYVQDALNPHYFDRFHKFNPEELALTDGRGLVDEDGDGQTDYSFRQPDINYIQFRSNLVVRWEYVPGSELFLVWSQGIVPNAFGELDTPIVQSLFENMFDHQPHNIFLVKVSYRFLN